MNSDSKVFAIFCCMWLGMAAGLIAGWPGIACVSLAITAIALAPNKSKE